MKKFTFAFIPLALVALGLTAFRANIFAMFGTNQVTFVETSYLVAHPAAHKGDLLVFQVPSASKDKQYYVHFNAGISPCLEETIPLQPGKPLQCKVTVAPAVATRYYFYVDSKSAPTVGRCPPWCSGMIVVGPVSEPVEEPLVPLPPQSDPSPASEVLIYNNSAGQPIADPATVHSGQSVTWVKNGPDSTGWSVQFSKDVCLEKQPIVWNPKKVSYCTLKADMVAGPYSYTITVGGTTGPTSQLNVVSIAPSSTPQ